MGKSFYLFFSIITAFVCGESFVPSWSKFRSIMVERNLLHEGTI